MYSSIDSSVNNSMWNDDGNSSHINDTVQREIEMTGLKIISALKNNRQQQLAVPPVGRERL